MTPEHEAYERDMRRIVDDAKLWQVLDADTYNLRVDGMLREIRALAARQPAPAADTGEAVAWRMEDQAHPGWYYYGDLANEPAPDGAQLLKPAHPAPLDAERVREDDYVTHHHDWRAACLIAKSVAVMECDVSYWQHQIDTLDRLWEDRAALRQKEGL